MDELLQAIEGLKRAYKASGVDMVTVEINLDETRVRIDGENFEMPKQKPITNGEWLRGLSDEELAGIYWCRICCTEIKDPSIRCKGVGCNDWKVAWLRAEHKED